MSAISKSAPRALRPGSNLGTVPFVIAAASHITEYGIIPALA
jgi:hypothetical protein